MAGAKILVLGCTGMLGNAMVRVLADDPELSVVATARSADPQRWFPPKLAGRFAGGVDVENPDSLAGIIADQAPDVVINCVGLVKQLSKAEEVLAAVPINSLLPHRIARLCKAARARLIHFSTDCVFSGRVGNYREFDEPDATDLYGVSKRLGEVVEPHVITLRTSIVGHELYTHHSLLEWFLSQSGSVKGYRRAIFSGFPTVELARIVRDHVLPRTELSGLYHVSADPISKLDLLRLLASAYECDIEIVPDEALVIDRSLNSDKFREATGFAPRSWPDMVADMRRFG